MRTHSRHALGLVLLLMLAAALSGCFRSAGGSLEPTPVAFEGAAPSDETPIVAPTMTATEETTEEPAGEATEEPDTAAILPTQEMATEPPTPIPPSPTTGDVAALPGDQGGAGLDLTPTEPVIAMLPTNTTAPLPTVEPTAGPTATFTSVPFNPLPPTPTYTQFMPPAEGEAVPQGEAMPLGELGPGTPPAEEVAPPADGQGGLEVAQVSTFTIPQMTSTQFILEYNMTQSALQGTIFPTNTPDPAAPQQDPGLEVQQQDPGVATPVPTVAPATTAGICSEHLISPGENLFRLSQRYGVTVEAIAQANNLVNPALILAGNTLQIPCPSAGTTPPAPGTGGGTSGTSPGTYIVEPGDNLYRISIRFGVSMSALMSANGMTPSTINFLRAGQQLVIP